MLYLAHDLSDAAVHKRCRMLREGGAEVIVAGFTRNAAYRLLPGEIHLGITQDGRFFKRLFLVATNRVHADLPVGDFDIVLARNIEMLALARRLLPKLRGTPRIIYECLDIHRLMLRRDLLGKILRWSERWLLRRVSALMTSSRGFVENYFSPVQDIRLPVLLVENKVLALEPAVRVAPGRATGTAPPLVIGWFGILRCQTSLRVLAALARRMEGRVEVVLRGKPALQEFDDFHATIEATPHLRFEGAYHPDELAAAYAQVDLIWTIDFFEQGQNSEWLLPNRIYEGCYHAAVPLVRDGTWTAAFTQSLGIGLTLEDMRDQTIDAALAPLLGARGAAAMAQLKSDVRAMDPRHFTYTRASCRALVDLFAQKEWKDCSLT